MTMADGEISMKAPVQDWRHSSEDIEWSRSRTMTMNSMLKPTGISCHVSMFAFLWKWTKPLVTIWIIGVETFLLIQIYWDHIIFYRLSISFISIPLLASSLFIAYTSYQSITSRFDSDRITHFSGCRRKCVELLLLIPVVNILLVLLPPPTVLIKNRVQYTLQWQSIFILSLCICMTFPQFILNICFILTYNSIPIYNWLQIITCVVSLSVFSLLHYAHTYAVDSIGEGIPFLNAIKLQLFWTKFQYYAEIFFYIYFIIVLLELLHCLPILFEYFYYHNIELETLMYLLIAFNGAKLLSFSPYIYNIAVSKGTNCCSNIFRFIFLLIIFIPIPLFPFMTLTYKSLFQKRVLLIDKDENANAIIANDYKQRVTNHSTATESSVGIRLRKSTTNTVIDDDDETDIDFDSKIDAIDSKIDAITPMQHTFNSDVNERSPIHDRRSTGSTCEDLRRYHTMDSGNPSLNSEVNVMNNGNDVNNGMSTNEEENEYHFEQYESMRSIKCQYFLLMFYLFIGYIGCNAWLIVNCGGIFCLGFKTQIMIYGCYGCVFIAVIIYSPFVLKKVLNKAQLVLIGSEVVYDDWAWI